MPITKTKNQQRLPAKPEPVAKAIIVKGLADLAPFHQIRVKLMVQGAEGSQPLIFEGRRLRPEESREVRLLLERALPPLIAPKPGAEETEPQYDLRSPTYLAEHEANRRKARALALWSAFPLFKADAGKIGAKPEDGTQAPSDMNAWDVDQVTRFIESREIDEDVLDTLFRAVTASLIDVRAAVGFTFGSSFPEN